MRDHLHRVTEIFTPTLLGDHGGIDLARGDIGRSVQISIEEALIVTDIKIGLRAVVGHEHLAMLEGIHGAGIDVEIGIQLLHGHA